MSGAWWSTVGLLVLLAVCVGCAWWCRREQLRAQAAANRAAWCAVQAAANAGSAARSAAEASRAALDGARVLAEVSRQRVERPEQVRAAYFEGGLVTPRVWTGSGWVHETERRITDDEVRRRLYSQGDWPPPERGNIGL